MSEAVACGCAGANAYDETAVVGAGGKGKGQVPPAQGYIIYECVMAMGTAAIDVCWGAAYICAPSLNIRAHVLLQDPAPPPQQHALGLHFFAEPGRPV